MNYNTGNTEHHYDVIVIGSGISGGYAAMELCEKGYKTLMLERGRMVKHGEYPTANLDEWELPNNNIVTAEERASKYFKQSRLGWWLNEDNKHWINDDSDYDYDEVERFDWIRGHHVGGRSIMWGRHTYRWSDIDFEANLKEGIAIDWPIRYKDIAPWYDRVERFIGVSGQKEGLKQVPDGQFLPPFGLNCVEETMRKRVGEKYPKRVVTPSRVANLSQYDPAIHKGTRGKCQTRNRCWRGCPYGAYFSSLSATIPVAEQTGNLTLRPNSIVTKLLFDNQQQKATGVLVKDTITGRVHEFYARIIFCNASTIGSTSILLNSTSNRFPNGMGNDSGELGHNLMDHHYGMGVVGTFPEMNDKYYKGRRPHRGFYIPRFTNIDESTKRKDYLRGFGYQGGAFRPKGNPKPGVLGQPLKESLLQPGPWKIGMTCFGEFLPYHENKLYLNHDKKDKYGQPIIVFDAKLRENEHQLRKDGVASAVEILEAAGCTDIESWNNETAPGACIHEMGTARMGNDPKTSVLNRWNQIHAVSNVFVTDGACMTSSATQNPSLTYMALTARAVDFMHQQINEGKL